MYHTCRMRNHTSNPKRGTIARASTLSAHDDERCRFRGSANNYKFSVQSSTSDINSVGCSSAPCQDKLGELDFPSLNSNCIGEQISSLSGVQSSRNLEDPGSDFNIKARVLLNSSTSIASSVFRYTHSNGKLVDTDAEISFRHGGHDAYRKCQRGRYIEQSSRTHGPWSRNCLVNHGRPTELVSTSSSLNLLCKGLPSKAPRKNDLTAHPLDRNTGVSAHRADEHEIVQHVSVSEPLLRAKGDLKVSRCAGELHANGRGLLRRKGQSHTQVHEPLLRAKGDLKVSRCAGELHANGRGLLRRKGQSHASDCRGMRRGDLHAGFRERNTIGRTSSRCSLSNLACSSAVDALPPISNSVLSNFACLSKADVLPSAPKSAGLANHFQSRKVSRTIGLLEEREVSRGGHAMTRQVKESNALNIKEKVDNHLLQLQEQGLRGNELHVSTPTQSLFNRSSFPSVQSLPPNYWQWDSNGAATQCEQQLRSSLWLTSPLGDGVPEFGGHVAEQWSARRSVYESQNSQYSTLHRSTSSALYEPHHTQPSFSGPPTRPPPLPPRPASFASQDEPIAISFQNASNSARSTGAGLHRHDEHPALSPTRTTVEGLSEILSPLEHLERDEELTYEQILMLEATLLLGGMGLRDRYRDMRMDIDNMSYEERLALEERIGDVHTGLNEASVKKCVRLEAFMGRSVPCGCLHQDAEIKCSICQEEFEEAEELGILECGHSYHGACITQWLSQKNQCPICKASALT